MSTATKEPQAPQHGYRRDHRTAMASQSAFPRPHVGRNPAGLVTVKVRFARRSLHSAQLQARQSERNVHGHRSFDRDRLQGEAAS
jgi:hypothetical protein